MPKLSPEDQQKVNGYLNAPQHQGERPAFRPWLLLIILLALLGLLSFVSFLISNSQGVI